MGKKGKNALCSCGSGKKFKECCLNKPDSEAGYDVAGGTGDSRNEWIQQEDAIVRDPEWLRMRRTEGNFVAQLIQYADARYGKRFWKEALRTFALGKKELDEDFLDSTFETWALFTWAADPDLGMAKRNKLPSKPLALEYLENKESELSDYEKAFIHAVCEQPFSFFEIMHVNRGRAISLRDVLLGREVTVKEAQASQSIKAGDILYARVVPLEDQAIMIGVGPIALSPAEHLRLLDLRNTIIEEYAERGLELNLENLRLLDDDLRDVYSDRIYQLRNPRIPELRNTDNDPISLAKLHFEITCSVEEAFEALKELAMLPGSNEIDADAKRDADGNLQRVIFHWMNRKNGPNKASSTLLGRLTIRGHELIAEVNSERRGREIRSEIESRLGDNVTFKRSVYDSLEALLDEEREETEEDRAREDAEERLRSRPEVQDLLRQAVAHHWESWYREPVPALGNITPLEAAKTPAGRERLEILMQSFERNNKIVAPELRVDIAAMRKRLGL